MPQDQNLAEGCWVLLQDIVSRPEINGCRAIVIGEFDSEKRRWPVRLINCKGRSEDMLLRPTNLVLLADSDSDQSDSSDGSGSKNDEDEELQQPGSKFQCDYKISQNMDQPYRSFSGAPLMSFHGSSVLFSTEAMQKHQFCNSTACPLGAGLSSEQLVQAFKRIKLRACEKCRNSWYCSKDCQVHDWVQGDHRAQCADIGLCRSKMLNPALSESDDDTESRPAPVAKAFRGIRAPVRHCRGVSKRVAKHVSGLTFEEKCTMEFLFRFFSLHLTSLHITSPHLTSPHPHFTSTHFTSPDIT